MLKRLTIALSMVVATATNASAAPVYGTAATLTGSRTQANLQLGGNYAGDTLSVAWNITAISGGWNYAYTFTGFSAPAISHVILELSQGTLTDPNIITNLTSNAQGSHPIELNAAWGPAPSNPGFPTGKSIYGVKFDFGADTPFTISFNSNRGPVWGDFYLKGGAASFAYNPGLTNHASESILDFIARPDSVQAVPEPSSLALLGLGAVGLAARGRLRRRTSAR